MNKCKHCDSEVTGRQVYCSNKCRMAFNRESEQSEQINPNNPNKANSQSEQNRAQSEQISAQSEQSEQTPGQSEHEQVKANKSEQAIVPGSYDDYLQDQATGGGRYVTRNNPELLHWGEWLPADELNKYKNKYKLLKYHNRTTIPGDWDYVSNNGSLQAIPGDKQQAGIVQY